MLKLYQYDVCPYCCKVKAVLDYKKIPYEKIEVNPMTHEELAAYPEAMKHDKVPVLIDGDKVILESNDIIRYLDKKYPTRPVFHADKAAEEEGWIRFGDDELVQILPANIYRSLPESLHSFKYITKVGKFPLWKRYYLALGGAVAMTIVAKKGMKKRGITDPRKALTEILEKWENGLGSKKFMGGGEPDVSDLVCYGILTSVRRMKVWNFISQRKKTADWFKKMALC
jgi:microsomal prostaglandin-E synthase 2